jgi:hypothetical protein
MDSEPEPATRAIADKLLYMFGVIAGASIVLSIVLVALLALFRPEAETGELIKALNTQISLIIGAVLGYIAREGVDRRHNNS